MTSADERATLVAMLRTGNASWGKVARRARERGSAIEVAQEEGLTAATLFDDSWAELLAQSAEDLREWDQAGYRFVTVLDEEYPQRLEVMAQMPPFIFTVGAWSEDDAEGVAVIGSRRATDATLAATNKMASELAEANVIVVSGLAAGVDTQAHRSTLQAAKRTVAVIGTGIARVFPRENLDLQEAISETGLVVSQFWPDAAPSKMSFPLRNELMAGWCWASCVMQADERSGARLQARVAVAQGRRLFFYRDMNREEWARKYVEDGLASFVESAEDILGERDAGAVD